MRAPLLNGKRKGEAGGITIMVALMLLVFITITAVGMSRNSFREVVISGTTRQGSLARNVADSGIEWSIYWLDYANSSSATDSAANLNAMKIALLQNSSNSGRAFDIMSSSPTSPTAYVPASATAAVSLPTITTSAGTTMTPSYSAGITRMGKLPITDMSQGVGTGAFAPAEGGESNQAPDLWAVRADAKVLVGSVTFIHAKEVWISTPVQ